MRKSLRRVLERLRAATDGKFRPRTSVRGGLQEPQRIAADPGAGARPVAGLTYSRAHRDRLHVSAARLRHRHVRGRPARNAARRRRHRRASTSSRSSTSRRARSGAALLSTIGQAVRGDYVRAARMLGRLDVDVVLLQHEYGIFGGRDGEYVLSFAEELAQPLVVTLHTVLSEPTPHQLEVLTELCEQAELVIVMTETAQRLLVECGACPEEKIRVVPHGAPARLTARAAASANGRTRARTRARTTASCSRRSA